MTTEAVTGRATIVFRIRDKRSRNGFMSSILKLRRSRKNVLVLTSMSACCRCVLRSYIL